MADNFIEFGGTVYYFDISALEKAISLDKKWDTKMVTEKETTNIFNEKGEPMGTEVTEKTYPKVKEIDGAKYDILRMCIETLIDYAEEADDALGVDRALNKTPLSYKLAFNTLLQEGILKVQE